MDAVLRTEKAPQCCPKCRRPVAVQSLHDAGDHPCPNCGHLLWFVRREVDGVVVLEFLPGLIAGSESLGLSDDVKTAVGEAPQVVVNLGSLRLISSTMLAMLVVLYRRMKAANGNMVLCSLAPDGREVFRITKLDLIFDIYEDEAAALAKRK
jgi:anti-sigma B factor antagonist